MMHCRKPGGGGSGAGQHFSPVGHTGSSVSPKTSSSSGAIGSPLHARAKVFQGEMNPSLALRRGTGSGSIGSHAVTVTGAITTEASRSSGTAVAATQDPSQPAGAPKA